MAGGDLLCLNTTQQRPPTRRARKELYHDINFVSRRGGGGGGGGGGCDTVGPNFATRRVGVATRQAKAYDTTGWGHDKAPNSWRARGPGSVRIALVQGVHHMHSTQF